MYKNIYSSVKKYKKKKIGFITIKNITILVFIIMLFIGIGYSYWNTTLRITGTVSAIGNPSGGGGSGTWDNPVEDSTTTTYDPTNVQQGTTLYSDVDGKPKVQVDRNGNITRFEYTDTGNGVTVPSGGLDTGVLGFDGNDFVVTLKAKFDYNNCTTTSTSPIINVSKKNSTVNGVLIFEQGRQTSGYGHNASGTKVTTPYNKFRFAKYENSSSKGNVDFNISSKVTSSQSNGRYGYNSSSSPIILTIKLYCTNGVFSAEMYDSSGTTDVLLAKPYNNTTYSFSDIGNSFDDITVVIGKFDGFGAGVTYTHTFDILALSIEKI